MNLGDARMEADKYVTPEARYAEMVDRMSGAPTERGAPPYPLYGTPMGQVESVPFWKRPLVTFLFGAVLVGGTWAYFGWLRPKMKMKRNGRKRRKMLAATSEE